LGRRVPSFLRRPCGGLNFSPNGTDLGISVEWVTALRGEGSLSAFEVARRRERSVERFFVPGYAWLTYSSNFGIGSEGMRVFNGNGGVVLRMSSGGISLGFGADVGFAYDQGVIGFNKPKTKRDSILRERDAVPPMTREMYRRWGPFWRDSLQMVR